MRLLRTAQFPAFALIIAAILGVSLANSPIGPALAELRNTHLGPAWLDLSVGHWVTDGLLAVFFFLAAIELKHELRHGELNSARKALVPTVAAVGGVVAPAVLFLLFVRDPAMAVGWPIPTATDIAFALGILALVGRHLPTRVRALLLALAVIDDLIAIGIIAFLFPGELQPLALLIAVPLVLLFGWLSYRRGAAVVVAMVLIGIVVWVLVAVSGIHPTIAGVALGLALSSQRGVGVRHAIEPWSNLIVLPVFAFVATLIVIPDVTVTPLGPVFLAILIALPVGKIIGITAGAAIAQALGSDERIPVADVLVVAALGGIGFTVSLLMNELAYENDRSLATEGTLGVLGASVIALVLGAVAGSLRSRWYAARGPRPTSGQ